MAESDDTEGVMAMEELAQIKADADKLRRRQYELEEQKRQQDMAAMIGKFFRYRNCYSCPKPDDYWWLYGTYLRIGQKVFSIQFQTDKDGKFTIEQRREVYPSGGWQRITRREYFAELHKAQKRVQTLEKLAAREG